MAFFLDNIGIKTLFLLFMILSLFGQLFSPCQLEKQDECVSEGQMHRNAHQSA